MSSWNRRRLPPRKRCHEKVVTSKNHVYPLPLKPGLSLTLPTSMFFPNINLISCSKHNPNPTRPFTEKYNLNSIPAFDPSLVAKNHFFRGGNSLDRTPHARNTSCTDETNGPPVLSYFQGSCLATLYPLLPRNLPSSSVHRKGMNTLPTRLQKPASIRKQIEVNGR